MELHITRRTALLLFLDIAATYAAYWLASVLTDVRGEVFFNNEIYFILGILAFINIAVLGISRLYNNLWEYASVDEAIQIVLSLGLSTFGGAVFLWVIDVRLPIRVFFVSFFLLIFFCGGVRMVYRVMRQKKRVLASGAKSSDRPRTLVVGAGETGSLTIDRMASKDPLMPGIPIVATDDDPAKRGLRIHGVKVVGGSEDILDLVDKYDIEQIVVAIPSATLEERRRIYGICTQTDCRLRTLPNVRELRTDELDDVSLRDVDVADLLGREEIILNTRAVSSYIAGETVLVTGGGGSIGSELCRQLCTVAPKRIVIFDMYENDAYLLRRDLSAAYDDIDVVVEIGNVCDKARIEEIFEKYQPGVVFHAAAHKHVPLMERCPREAVQNNVFGTLNTVRAADEHGVKRFIFISTDKAVNPTSVMGATKRMGEMIMQYYARTSKTVFSAVRFGNVLGSNGSVIPVFKTPDCRRRSRDGHASGHRTLLHDHTRGVSPGHPGRRHGRRGRDLHSRHGRSGEDRRPCAQPYPAFGADARRGYPDRVHWIARRREDVRGAAHGRREHASYGQFFHHGVDRPGDKLRRGCAKAR